MSGKHRPTGHPHSSSLLVLHSGSLIAFRDVVCNSGIRSAIHDQNYTREVPHQLPLYINHGMHPELHLIASGIHGSVYAYRRPLTAATPEQSRPTPPGNGQHESGTDSAKRDEEALYLDDGGLPGWGVVKTVRAGPSGKTRGLKPHNILKEVLLLQKAKHPNVVNVVDYAWSEGPWMHELALPLLAFPLSRIFETGFNSDLRSYRQSRGTSAPGSSSRQSAADALPDLSTLVINDAQNTTATPAPFELSSTRPTQHLLFQSISLQLLTALAHLHKLGIAHRDIKPDNIMFAWDGAVLLVDFGTCWDEGGEDWGSEWKECRDAESADGEGGLYERSDADVNADADAERGLCMEVGTGAYRAPELLFGPHTYDPSAIDIWATGCILAQFYTSSLPTSTSQIYGAHDDSDNDEMDDYHHDLIENQSRPLDGDSTEHIHSSFDADDSGFAHPTLFTHTYGDLGLAASIFRIKGTPSPTNWPSFFHLPDANKITFPPSSPTYPPSLASNLSSIPNHSAAKDLIDNLLQLDPARRISAMSATLQPYFGGNVVIPRRLLRSDEYIRIAQERLAVGLGELGDELHGLTVRGLLQPWLSSAKIRWEGTT